MRCLVLATLAFALAGCSDPAAKSPHGAEPTPVAAPQPPATPAPIAAQPADDASASARAAAAPKTCREAIGEDQAKVLVEHCLQVSPATHPPCNVENSCDLIQSEIDRGCDLLGKDGPTYCKKP